ncbi:hypothetical protein WN51_00897 [Melipona quadrifasciata]|uniref:Uncharacterized protein n=1 Tax=Melipona quadrifasciata TaxID=166423 RepID=A0A0M9ADL4_9HYME|nr:hypothetical protein WN51_00897 [Melipona quadrifasciata]
MYFTRMTNGMQQRVAMHAVIYVRHAHTYMYLCLNLIEDQASFLSQFRHREIILFPVFVIESEASLLTF